VAVALVAGGLLRVSGGIGGRLPPLPPPVEPPPPTTVTQFTLPARIPPLRGEGVAGTHLYLGGGRRAAVVDLARGAVRSLRVPGGGRVASVSTHGSTVVFVRSRTVSVLPARATDPVTIGQAQTVLPSSDPAMLWLVRPDYSFTRPAWLLEPVGVSGVPRREPYRLSDELRPVAVVDGDAAVVVDDGRGLAVHDLRPAPRLDLGRRRLVWPGATFVDSVGSLVAWVDQGGELRVTDLDTGAERTVRRPPGVLGWIPSAGSTANACCQRFGAFSPGGSLLAVTLRKGHGRDAIGLVRTSTLAVTEVEGSSGALAATCLPCFDWSEGGGWLLFTLGQPSRLGAYQLGGRARPVDLPAFPIAVSFAVR
jgi:hypothetical protein